MKSVYVSPYKGTEVSPSEGTLIEPYARIPVSVLYDKTISGFDVRVFGVLAKSVREGNTCSIGVRFIADQIGSTRRLVNESIQRLIAAKHVAVPAEKKRGMRSMYVLTSKRFAQKQGKVNVVRSSPRGKRLVSVEKIA